jgi:hypothetical protein
MTHDFRVAERDHVTASWASVVRAAAYLAAAALAATTLLYLLDATDVLQTSPAYHPSGGDPLTDEAAFFAAYFNHQHAIWWDIALRDTLGPVAFLSLVAVGVGLANLWGWRRPAMQFVVGLLSFGAVFATVNSVLYLGELNYWRSGGWRPDPAAGMVAIGRSAEALDHLTLYPEAFGFTLIAVAILVLARTGRWERSRGTTSVLGYAEAVCLLGLVASSVAGFGIGYDILAVTSGIILGPLFLIAVVNAATTPARLALSTSAAVP